MTDQEKKDLKDVRNQIAVIQQELSKVNLLQTNLARLQGVEGYLAAKDQPKKETPLDDFDLDENAVSKEEVLDAAGDKEV